MRTTEVTTGITDSVWATQFNFGEPFVTNRCTENYNSLKISMICDNSNLQITSVQSDLNNLQCGETLQDTNELLQHKMCGQ